MKRHTLIQLKKNLAVLIIDRIILDHHPNVYQFSFSIQN
jgi:hypothetical protein